MHAATLGQSRVCRNKDCVCKCLVQMNKKKIASHEAKPSPACLVGDVFALHPLSHDLDVPDVLVQDGSKVVDAVMLLL